MHDFKNRMLGDEPLSECQLCYHEEQHGHESKRIKENFKVGIFSKQSFEKSFAYSAWHDTFVSKNDVEPYDWHVDFGNECNLACKMCSPVASSKIAGYYNKWNIAYNRSDNWINDDYQWNQFLKNVEGCKKLFRIHVMGGEPTISKKFLKFIEKLIDQGRTSISISFVTNGTIINELLVEHLLKFSLVNIEVSIESILNNNEYIRQGSSTDEVLKNIDWYRNNTNFQIVLRSVPQLLSVNTYSKFILWAYEQQLSVQSIPLINPDFLQVSLLPDSLKQRFIGDLEAVKNLIDKSSEGKFETISTGRDTSRLPQQLIAECDSIINLLSMPAPGNLDELQKKLVAYLVKWDNEFKLDAREFYPEYDKFFDLIGYAV
jgi:organic radical activating enzyme